MDYLQQQLVDNFNWKWVLLAGGSLTVFMIKRYMAGQKCLSKDQIPDKTVIITGANCGIGRATALELAKRQARVILACRDVSAAETTAAYIRKRTSNDEVIVRHLDLASLKSVKEFAENITASEKNIDILVNNAGVFQCPYSKTEDGYEMQMGVNHLGHFYLTNLLLDILKSSAPSRVVVVSSGLSKLGKIDFDNFNSQLEYNKSAGYKNSKLANNLFARELARKLDGTGVSVFALRPGMARTNLGRHIPIPSLLRILLWPFAWMLVKSETEACQTVVYCAVAGELDGKSDMYFGNCQEEPWPDNTKNLETARKLWNVSCELTGLQVS